MQGDCLSATLFIFYLAQALNPPSDPIQDEHSYTIQSHAQIKWKTFIKETNTFIISPKYADDTTWVSNNPEIIRSIKENIPPMLKNYNLQVNASKTEEYAVPFPPRCSITSEHNYSKPPDQSKWKKCKLLGSHIDTETDIQRRRGLVITNMKNHKQIYNSKHLSQNLKIRHFNAFQTSIFLYNCSLWTLTLTMERKIDAFHRRQLRYALGIHYPKRISNENLYELTKATPWSKTIKHRRLRLLGHICRLPEDTPVRQSLAEVIREYKKKCGRPKSTWLSLVKKDLDSIGIPPDDNFQNVINLAQDRAAWRNHVQKHFS